MTEVQTSDMMICRSEGGMPRSAWQLTSLTSAVNDQSEHGISPSDRRYKMTEAQTSDMMIGRPHGGMPCKLKAAFLSRTDK